MSVEISVIATPSSLRHGPNDLSRLSNPNRRTEPVLPTKATRHPLPPLRQRQAKARFSLDRLDQFQVAVHRSSEFPRKIEP